MTNPDTVIGCYYRRPVTLRKRHCLQDPRHTSPLVSSSTHVHTDGHKTVCSRQIRENSNNTSTKRGNNDDNTARRNNKDKSDSSSSRSNNNGTKTTSLIEESTDINGRSNTVSLPSCDMSRQVQSEGRQRMRPWLEYHIKMGDTPGLAWINQDEKIFRVPWKHVGNREWVEADGTIFKLWAVHTGRFRENVDQPDWPTWKTRFRCALTKLPDIKERKELNRLDGQTDEPYRVYQFVERNNADTNDSPRHDLLQHDDFVYNQREDFTPMHYENPLPTVLSSGQSSLTGVVGMQLDSDLMNIESGDLVKCNSGDIRAAMTDSLMDVDDNQVDARGIARKSYPGHERPTYLTVPSFYTLDPTDCKLYVTVRYMLDRVLEKLCASPSGCRIFYDKHVPITDPHEFDQMYGSKMAEEVRLPEAGTYVLNPQQQKSTLDILNAADRGLYLQVRNGNIYATRKCRCRIYISTPAINNGEAIKLERDVETNIFDVEQYFKPALHRYIQQSGPKPSADVTIGFGQHFTTAQTVSSLLVSASVVHTEAYNLLTKLQCSHPLSPQVEISNSNDLDRKLDLEHHRRL